MRNDGEESLAIFSVRMIIFVNVLTTENEVTTKFESLNITSTSSLNEVHCHASSSLMPNQNIEKDMELRISSRTALLVLRAASRIELGLVRIAFTTYHLLINIHAFRKPHYFKSH
jgi:hypothetical protein